MENEELFTIEVELSKDEMDYLIWTCNNLKINPSKFLKTAVFVAMFKDKKYRKERKK